MHIKELQTEVDTWITTTGVRYFNELTNLGILMEEVGELSRIIVRKYGEQSFKESDKIFFDLLIDITDVINGQFRKEKNIFVTPEESTEKCLNDYPEAQKALDEFTWKELKADEKS